MSYVPTIPKDTDQPTLSQGQMLTNFGQLNTLFDIDHVTFDDATVADRGEHNKITFNDVLGADPGVVDPKCKLYTKNDAATKRQLFFQNPDLISQLTNLTVVTVGTNYGVTTPWGLIINWGSTIIAGGSADSTLTSFAVAFPAAGQSMTISQFNSTANRIGVTLFNTSQYRVKRSATTGALTVYYFAIGI